MANTASTRKRIRQALKRRNRNRSHRTYMKTAVKTLREAVESGDAKLAQELLPKTIGIVDSIAQKGVIHRNAAARTASRLTRAVNALG